MPNPDTIPTKDRCEICKGRGTYMVREKYSDGDEVIVPYECGTCMGTGLNEDARESGDYDFGGDVDDED